MPLQMRQVGWVVIKVSMTLLILARAARLVVPFPIVGAGQSRGQSRGLRKATGPQWPEARDGEIIEGEWRVIEPSGSERKGARR